MKRDARPGIATATHGGRHADRQSIGRSTDPSPCHRILVTEGLNTWSTFPTQPGRILHRNEYLTDRARAIVSAVRDGGLSPDSGLD